MRWPAGLVAAIGALCALPAGAQTAPAGDGAVDGDAIVVTGRKEAPSRGAVAEQAEDVSRVGRYQLYEEALPRFEQPLCPGVFGLKRQFAAMVVDRIRANAARLDVELAGEKCSPNLLVAFVDDGQSFLARLQRTQPEMFRLTSASERRELLAGDGPVHVWSNIETRRSDGSPLPRWRGKEQLPSVKGRVDRLFLPTRRDINSALIVFDRKDVREMPLAQIADYATMRGLAHTRPPSRAGSMETILALFEEEDAPPELTSFDVGYLRSLYFWRPDLPAVTKFLGVRRRAEEAGKEPSDP